MTDTLPTRRRQSRFWLYGPFLLLVILAAAWSAFWFYARARASAEIDTALARDAERSETGPALAVGQIYSPSLVIFELSGPAKATLPEGRMLDLTWTNLDASFAWRNPERFALVASDLTAVLTVPGLNP